MTAPLPCYAVQSFAEMLRAVAAKQGHDWKLAAPSLPQQARLAPQRPASVPLAAVADIAPPDREAPLRSGPCRRTGSGLAWQSHDRDFRGTCCRCGDVL